MFIRLFVFTLLPLFIGAATIQDKVLICGVCRDIEPALVNLVLSATRLGEQFLDYRVIIYENNSTDATKDFLSAWAQINPRVIFSSENITRKTMEAEFAMKIYNRTEAIARARNRVLDIAMQDIFSDYKYVVFADLDFIEPWDINHIVDTILHPEQEWDAVLANGAYDLFAFRDPEFPIGFELLGNRYWRLLTEIRKRFSLDPSKGWRKVYSAFGGLGIFKREAIQGCRYSGVVTKETERYVLSWFSAPSFSSETCLVNEYTDLLRYATIVNIKTPLFFQRASFPCDTGTLLNNDYSEGKVTWFSCTLDATLPYICEHIPFYADMVAHGHDKIFVNPALISNHPEEEKKR